jgi:Squalene epoxidase
VSPRLLSDFCTHPSTHPSLLPGVLQRGARLTLHVLQVRTLVDVPGEKLPSAATGALQEYLRTQVGPQVGRHRASLTSGSQYSTQATLLSTAAALNAERGA